jgi:hypothetical protein
MRIPLDILPGIASDDTPHAAPWRYADGSNVRFTPKPETIGGWRDAFSGDILSGVCRNAIAWSTGTGTTLIAFGTHTHLMTLSSGNLLDITPVALAPGSADSTGGAAGYGTGAYGDGTYGSPASVYFARTWSLDTFGSWLLANPRGGTIYSWDGTGLAEAVANAPSNVTCSLVTPERQVLAFGCNEELSGDYNPMCIRGSDIEDITTWATAPNNNAFEHILEGGGRIVRAFMLGSQVAVWTDNAVHLGTFVGAAGQAYRFDLIASGCGLVGPNAVVVINQTAYWITPDFQIYAWQIGAPPTPLRCPIQTDFKNNMVGGQVEKVVACSINAFSEVWFFYPDARDGIENTRYIAVSLAHEGLPWFRGELPRTAAIDSGPTPYPLFADAQGRGYWHENGHTAAGNPFEAYITTSDMYLDEAENRVLARGIWPDFEGQEGEVTLAIDFRDYPQSTARTKGPYTLSVGRERKDFLAEGRIASLTFWSLAAPSFWRLGKPSFDIATTGRR